MKDEKKTKAELIEELNTLRQEVAELRSAAGLKPYPKAPEETAARRAERKAIRTHIEFIGDFDIIEAQGVNISEGGICFETDEDLPFEMRFELNGYQHHHRAHLVWVKRLVHGGHQFGLMFVRPLPKETF